MSGYGKDPIAEIRSGYGQDPVVESGYGKDPLVGETTVGSSNRQGGDLVDAILKAPTPTSPMSREVADTLAKAFPRRVRYVKPDGSVGETSGPLPGFAEREMLEQPTRRPGPPATPRSLLGEAGAASIRGLLAPTRSAGGFLAGLFGGPELAREVLKTLPAGPAPSREDILGRLSNMIPEFATSIAAAGGFARPRSPTFIHGVAGRPQTVSIAGTFGGRSYENVLERTEGNQAAALSAALVSGGLGVVPITALTGRIPGLDQAIQRLGTGPVSSAITKATIEAMASGTANVGIGIAEEQIAQAGDASALPVPYGELFATGFLGHGLLSAPRTLNEVRRFAKIKRMATEAKLITPEESAYIGDRPELLSQIATERAKGNIVEVKPVVRLGEGPTKDAQGNYNLKIDIRPDVVTQREKFLLGHAEPMIDAYRRYREKGGAPLSEFDGEAPWLAFASARREGYLRPAEDVVERPALRDKVSQLQRRYGEQLLELQTGAKGFSIGERALLTSRLDAEFTERMSNLVAKDTDNAKGARRSVMKALEKEPEASRSPAILDDLKRALDTVEQKFPQETQLGTIERLLEEIDTGAYHGIGVSARQMLEKVRGEIEAGNKEFLPASARVRQAQEALQGLLEGGLKRVENAELVAKLAEELPQAKEREFGNKARGAKTDEELQAVAQDVLKAQQEFLTETTTKRLVGDLEKLGKNPKRDEVIRFLERVKAREQAALPAVSTPLPGVESAIRFRGKVYTSPIDHYHAAINALQKEGKLSFEQAEDMLAQDLTEQSSLAQELTRTMKGDDEGFVYRGKYFTRKEMAQELAASKRTPETASDQPLAAVRYKGKVYTGEGDHSAVIKQILRDKFGISKTDADIAIVYPDKFDTKNPELAKTVRELLALGDDDTGFVQGGKYRTRDEQAQALGLRKGATSDEVKGVQAETPAEKPQSLTKTDAQGYTTIDTPVLLERLKTLSLDELTTVANDVRELMRKGQIEQGLYARWQRFSPKQDAKDVTSELGRYSDVERGQARDTAVDVTKTLGDPVGFWARFMQIARDNPESPFYKIFHGNLRVPYDRHRQNLAQRSRFAHTLTREIYGINGESIFGLEKLGRYLNKKLVGNLTRGEIMDAYGTSRDPGRRDINKVGVDKDGKVYKLDDILPLLSAKDKQFVERMVEHFRDNPYINKGHRNVLALTGRPVNIIKGWYPSTRRPETKALDSDFDSFTSDLVKELDVHKDRAEHSGKPYTAQDFYTKWMNITEKLSMYGEMGRDLHRMQKLIINRDFEKSFIDKFGKKEYEWLKLYAKNIVHGVGHMPTSLDEAITTLQSGFAVSKTGLNLFSAVKQYFGVSTLYADGVLDASAITQALAESAALPLRRSVRKDMIARSGLSYDRFVGGDFLKQLVVMGEQNATPGKLGVGRHLAMVMQRTADRQVLTVAWRAARLTAKARGFKGPELDAAQEALFSEAVGRGQPTDNPLYASRAEIFAKRQPLARGFLQFAREQNRIYTIVRHKVVRAAQQPTAANMAMAGRALLFGVIGNVAGVVAVNQLRRLAFGKPTDEKDLQRDAVSNLVGMWYAGDAVGELVNGIIDVKNRYAVGGKGGPLTAIVTDMVKAGLGFADSLTAEDDIKSGVNRGDSRSRQVLVKGVESALSAGSAIMGLPLWSIYQQAKGLYRWNDDQLRLMTYLEHEKAQLKEAGQEATPRYRELEAAKERINKIHRQRERGLLDRKGAQRLIEGELKRVVK